MLIIYTFVFSIVFKVRLEQSDNIYDDKYHFVLMLFIGIITYNLFSECLSRAPNLILSNTNFVKKIIFPLEILPLISLGAALFHAGISLLILMISLLIVAHSIQWTVIFLPFIIFPLLLVIIGLSWALASIGVFIRDIGQFIGLILTMLLFLSPIFYPVSALPESVRDYLFLNPLTLIIEQLRIIILYGQLPNWEKLGMYYIIAFFVAWIGLMWFEHTRKGFSDVL